MLDHSGRVKRLGADGALRDTMFSGHKIRTICKKAEGKEIWAVDESTEEIAVDADGRTRALTIPGLDDTQHVRAISVFAGRRSSGFLSGIQQTCEIRNRHHRNPAWFGWRGGVVGKVVPADLRSIRSVHDDLLQRHHFYLCPRNMSRTTIHRSHDVGLCRVLKTISLFPDARAITVTMATGEVNIGRRFAGTRPCLGIVRTVDGSLGAQVVQD